MNWLYVQIGLVGILLLLFVEIMSVLAVYLNGYKNQASHTVQTMLDRFERMF